MIILIIAGCIFFCVIMAYITAKLEYSLRCDRIKKMSDMYIQKMEGNKK